MTEKKEKLTALYTPVLVLLLVVAAFFVGRLSIQVESMKGGETKAAADPGTPGSKINNAGLKTMAKQLKLNEKKFAECLDTNKYDAKVTEDQNLGSSFGVSGTPSFFINGLLVVGSLPQTEFEKIIDAELKDNSGDKQVTSVNGTVSPRVNIEYGKGYVKGNKDAKIKLVEFTDFECPYCAQAFPTIEKLLEKYGNDISLEYRSYPLSFHADARGAANAAECAGEQGKFWEMHDLIFSEMGK